MIKVNPFHFVQVVFHKPMEIGQAVAVQAVVDRQGATDIRSQAATEKMAAVSQAQAATWTWTVSAKSRVEISLSQRMLLIVTPRGLCSPSQRRSPLMQTYSLQGVEKWRTIEHNSPLRTYSKERMPHVHPQALPTCFSDRITGRESV